MASDDSTPLERANQSLVGLSVGDALGGFFEFAYAESKRVERITSNRELPSPPWRFTDDTNMALSIYSVLRQVGHIDQDRLTKNFADHFDIGRGYGMGAIGLIRRIQQGADWRTVAPNMFDGTGSYGNGGAMRVAPIGAYFAGDIETVIEQAKLATEITHTHPEAIAGAIAVAVMTSLTWQAKQAKNRPSVADFINQVIEHTPESLVRTRLTQALTLSPEAPISDAVSILGNGSNISAQDTVPFVIWSAATHLDNFEDAIWNTIRGGGDADTTAAMVGGIVAMFSDVPQQWIDHREPLPDWAFHETSDG